MRSSRAFKLANALIALDAGVLVGADAPMTWDRVAVPDDPSWPDTWRKPQTLRSALAVSAVPHFRSEEWRVTGARRQKRASLGRVSACDRRSG